MGNADFSITVDSDGIVNIVQSGFWSRADAEAFTTAATPIVMRAQAKGPLLLVIDATRMQVPSADVSDILAAFDARIRRDGDRIAMIVDSSLLRMQMKRKIDRTGIAVFTSPSAAREWIGGAASLPSPRS